MRSFVELDERQRAIAGLLRSEGLGRGDRVAVHSDNRPEMLEVTIGALRAALVPVPIHRLLTAREVSYVLEDSGAAWLFTDRPIDAHIDTITFGDAYERSLHEAEPSDLADHALTRPMHYTSGTTGRPKGVWVAPYSEKEAARRSASFRNTWAIAAEDRHLVCSPLSHSAPHRYALRTLEAGGAVIVQPRFDPSETLAAIELFGATTAFMVPTHLERIFQLDEPSLLHHDVSSMRMLAHAGAPIRETTKRNAIDLFPAGSVWEFYGSTEGQVSRISADEWLRKPGSVGRPEAKASVLVLGDDNDRLAAGEIGDVWIDDPDTERFEYWGDPAATAEAWRGRAYSVGDRGWLDEDGYLFLAGRRDDMIISGGVNVQPQDVEGVLSRHPAVAEALVYGVPHEEWGQETRAAIVPSPGAAIDVAELESWARRHLAGYKRPRRIELVDELPRSPTGKLKRVPPPHSS